jgi:hypothetical protein
MAPLELRHPAGIEIIAEGVMDSAKGCGKRQSHIAQAKHAEPGCFGEVGLQRAIPVQVG